MDLNERWKLVEQEIDRIIEGQKQTLLKLGRRFVPTLTPEDMLQPNDYPELEYNPHFRYEEGVLAGAQTVQMAFQAIKEETGAYR